MIGEKTETRYAWLDKSLASDAGRQTVIVTASRRLARELRATWDQRQLAAGKTSWLTPAIYYWQDWLRGLLSDAEPTAVAPRRLDGFSSAILWERCLRKHVPDGLLGFSGVVRQAGLAWQRLSEWNIPLAEIESAAQKQDERLFVRAALDYQQRLDDESWVDRAGAAAQTAEMFRNSAVELNRRLLFAGFDQLTPAAMQVISAAKTAGIEVQRIPTPERYGSMSTVSFEREESELRAAGAWARSMLAADPKASVAVICPGLESNATDSARWVREGAAPGWQYGDHSHQHAVNISYGRALSEYPAIAVALNLLRWAHNGLTSHEISVLLRSRSMAGTAIGGRCRLEFHLRRYPDREWSADKVAEVLEGDIDGQDAADFVMCVRDVAGFAESVNDFLRPEECVSRIDALLQKVRWPGEAVLDSTEFQLVNRWRELLNELARIATVAPRVRLSEAIRYLAARAAETVWQPESDAGRVQVMGPLEAAGMEFDGIWISGLDSAQWPPASRPSAFIPHSLQRQYEMPDATPGITLEYTKRVFHRLTRSARRCVLSWSRISGDLELTASPLLAEPDTTDYSGPGDPGRYATSLLGDHTRIERAGDESPIVDADEKISGGAYTIQQQFVEPISAFASGRLGVRLPGNIATGMSASTRGIIIHDALHYLLRNRPDQEQMGRWTNEDRQRRIIQAIDSALSAHTVHANAVIHRILEIERNRLLRLFDGFLDSEIQRGEFIIAAVEKKIDYKAGGLSLALRIDRIDRLPDGRLLIIDYKTGAQKHFVNREGEVIDLQLVVYADAVESDVGGLVFINLDSRDITYKAAGGGWDGRQESSWQQTFERWRTELHDTCQLFASGDVRIDIGELPGKSRALQILSRIEEQKRFV